MGAAGVEMDATRPFAISQAHGEGASLRSDDGAMPAPARFPD